MTEMISFPWWPISADLARKGGGRRRVCTVKLILWALSWLCFFFYTGDQHSCHPHYSRWLINCAPSSPSLSVTRSVQYCWGEIFHWHPCDADSDPNPVMNGNTEPFTLNVRLVPKRDGRCLGTSQGMQLHFHYFIARIFTLVKHIYNGQTRSCQRTDRTNFSFKVALASVFICLSGFRLNGLVIVPVLSDTESVTEAD